MATLAHARRSGAKRILVVEDVTDIREVLTLLLEIEGAEVVATGTGRDAVSIGADGDFDVLLTDFGLPDIPGDVVIREIVARAKRRPWIIVVTGYGQPHIQAAREAGADVVLAKPVAWETLMAYLDQAPIRFAA